MLLTGMGRDGAAGLLAMRNHAGHRWLHLDPLAARYGGEEFAIVLPDTGMAGALVIVEAGRSHLEALAIDNAGSPASDVVTMSIGVATMVPGSDSKVPDLVERADKALYAAKSSGRNKVCTAEE